MSESKQQELDQLLLRKPLPRVEDRTAMQARLKQVSEDFRNLQVVNNKIVAVATQKELDYRYVAEMIAEIGSLAGRLKSNLQLPVAKSNEIKGKPEKSGESDISAELRALDELIVRFTTNPVFRATNVVDVDLAKQASKDLSAVIERSKELKQRLRKFSKTTKPQ